MSQATNTPTTSVPRRAREAGGSIEASDAIDAARAGCAVLYAMADSSAAHHIDHTALGFVAEAIERHLDAAEAAMPGQSGDDTSDQPEPGGSEDDADTAEPNDGGDSDGPTVEALYYEWRRNSSPPSGAAETDAESTARMDRGFAAECAMVTTPSTNGWEIRYKLEVLAEMHDCGTPIEPRSRVMLASIVGDVTGLLG